ncbi:putative Serine/threonine-protein kinase CTR1 [Paratrimastix pyriformis]|uniref:Serine/threonine-protein kinase CTR1 n=1 Tax=Paratrimastix pyriformis TaxID=342808 RepID=A0ABQ8ULF4_9EUKA|nr:putative Serine/threonine-protein kinase CTR1 [Paratrimastix pyriformis]
MADGTTKCAPSVKQVEWIKRILKFASIGQTCLIVLLLIYEIVVDPDYMPKKQGFYVQDVLFGFFVSAKNPSRLSIFGLLCLFEVFWYICSLAVYGSTVGNIFVLTGIVFEMVLLLLSALCSLWLIIHALRELRAGHAYSSGTTSVPIPVVREHQPEEADAPGQGTLAANLNKLMALYDQYRNYRRALLYLCVLQLAFHLIWAIILIVKCNTSAGFFSWVAPNICSMLLPFLALLMLMVLPQAGAVVFFLLSLVNLCFYITNMALIVKDAWVYSLLPPLDARGILMTDHLHVMHGPSLLAFLMALNMYYSVRLWLIKRMHSKADAMTGRIVNQIMGVPDADQDITPADFFSAFGAPGKPAPSAGAPPEATPLVAHEPLDRPLLPKSVVQRREVRAKTREHMRISAIDLHIRRDELDMHNIIGKGAVGTVYHGSFRKSEVAIKQVTVSDEKTLIEVLNESTVMSKLRHPNVVAFLGLTLDPPSVLVVTEFMSRGSLFDILHNPDIRLPWKSRIEFALHTARAMNYLHSFAPPLIHRDLKSPNLLVDKNWVVKVADFGLTRFKSDAKMTICGSPHWTAPELLAGREDYTEKIDVYSFGIVLYEILTRLMPYGLEANTMHISVEVSVHGRRPPIPPGAPEAWVSLMTRCWDQRPEARPSFESVAVALMPAAPAPEPPAPSLVLNRGADLAPLCLRPRRDQLGRAHPGPIGCLGSATSSGHNDKEIPSRHIPSWLPDALNGIIDEDASFPRSCSRRHTRRWNWGCDRITVIHRARMHFRTNLEQMQRDEVTTQFLNKFERGIFGIFYLGRLESPLPRVKTIFFIIQTLQLFFQLVAIPAVFSLSLWVQIPIWILDASMTRLTLGVLYALFGVASFVTLASAVASVVLGLVVTKDSGAGQWPLRIVRGFYFLLSWVLFVPAFGIFLDVIDCTYRPGGVVTHDLFPTVACWALPHAVPSALSLLLILVFLVFAAGNALFVFPSAGFDSRSRGRFDLLVLLAKCLIVCAERVLTVHTVLRVVLIMASTGVVLVMLLWMLPYHTRLANMMVSRPMSCHDTSHHSMSRPDSDSEGRAAECAPSSHFMGEYWVCFLAALEWSILNLALPQYADGWVPFVILVGAYIRYTATLALKRADVRRLLCASQSASTPNPSGPRILSPTITPPADEGTPASSAPLEDGAQLLGGDLPSADAVVARCRWSLSVEWATRFLRWKEAVGDARLQALAKAIYAKGTAKFPESHGLLLNYAEFLYTLQRNSASAMSLIRRVTALPGTALDTRFSIYAAERRFESASEGAQAAGLMNAITQRRLLRQAQSHHRRAKNRLARVWAFLMRPHMDIQSLPPLLDSAVAHANTALEAYSSLLQSFPTNVPLLRAYGSLLQDLYGDTELSDSLFIQADQLEEEKGGGGGGGTGGTDGESVGPSVANTAKKGSLGRAPSMASRQTRSQMSLTLGEGGTGFDHRSVIAFLLRRHKGAATSDASSEDGPEDVAGGCTPLRATTWAVFLLTVVTVAFLAGCLVILYTAVDASSTMGAILVGNSNCSVMVQKMAYVSRKIFEGMMQGGTLLPDGSYSVDNFTLSPDWKPKVQGWVAKLTVLANTMNGIIQTSGAQGALREAWTTWEYPMALPVVSGGVLTTINFAKANLFALAQDMIGKSRHVGLSGVAQLDTDPIQSELLYMMFNGPYILGPALANISWPVPMLLPSPSHTHTGSGSVGCTTSFEPSNTPNPRSLLRFLQETSPFYTGACALLFCLGGVLINCLSLRYVGRERRGVMAFYVHLPRDVVRAEYTRLKKNKEAEETDAPVVEVCAGAPARVTAALAADRTDHRTSSAAAPPLPLAASEEAGEGTPGDMVAPPSLAPPRGAGTGSPDHSSSAAPPSATEGGDMVMPSPVTMAVPATPIMTAGPLPLGPDLHKRMQVSLEDLPASDEDADEGSPESRRRGQPSLRHPSDTGAVGSIPENPLASLLAMTQAASTSLLPPLSGRTDQEEQEERHPTDAAPVRAVMGGEAAAASEKEGSATEGEAQDEEKSEAHEADAKKKDNERRLASTGVVSKNLIIRPFFLLLACLGRWALGMRADLIIRLTVAVAFSTLFILGTGFVGYSQASSVTPFFGQVAAYGARGAQLAQTNVLAYQLIYNHTIAYRPFAGVDPAVEARVRYLLEVDETYPLGTTDRNLLRRQIGSSLRDLNQLHNTISSVAFPFRGPARTLPPPQWPLATPLTLDFILLLPVCRHSLWASPEIHSLWFDVHECLLYPWSQWRCVPGRIVGWPNNGTLAELFSTYLQAVNRLTSMGDVDLVPSNLDFQFIDTAFDWDLIEGIGRVTLLFRDSFNAVVASQLNQVVIFYTLCMISVLLGYLFLYRVNVIKTELTKTALMRALLPNEAFGPPSPPCAIRAHMCRPSAHSLLRTWAAEVSATSLNSVPPTNVKELDELHLAIAKTLNDVRDSLIAMQPLPQLAEGYEVALAAIAKSFEVEERMMRQHAMPARKAHAADHAAQLKKYGDVLPSLREERPEAMDVLMSILRERLLIAHCAKFDVAMGHFLNRRGVF